MKPHRVKLSRKLGWKMPPGTVKVDRSTKFGNPFVVDGEFILTKAKAIQYFRELLTRAIKGHPLPAGPGGFGLSQEIIDHFVLMAELISQIRGKNLACWCDLDQPCHADVLLE